MPDLSCQVFLRKRITAQPTLPHGSARKAHGWTNVNYMTTKKTTKKTAAKKPAKKAAAKKAPAKKAVAKKAPAKKAAKRVSGSMSISSTTETNIIKPSTPSTSGAVIYASEIKNTSLRDRVFAWFKN